MWPVDREHRILGVALYGTGRAGTEIVRACGHRDDLRLVAAVAVNPDKDGADLGSVTVGDANGVRVTCDLDAVLANGEVDVVLHAGLGDPRTVAAVLGRCADAGKDAITVSGLVHPRTALGDHGAEALNRRAVAGGARLVGTGVNPGFLLDVLPAMLGSMLARVDRMQAIRVSEIRNWGAGALNDEVGLGLPVDAARNTSALALGESLALVDEALDLQLDRLEDIHEVLASSVFREHEGRTVAPGQTVGFRKRAVGYRGDRLIAEIEWRGVFCLDAAEDGVAESAAITLDGDVHVEATSSGTFFGDPYPSTAARAVNAIAPLRNLPPGLFRPDQLPAAGGTRRARPRGESMMG